MKVPSHEDNDDSYYFERQVPCLHIKPSFDSSLLSCTDICSSFGKSSSSLPRTTCHAIFDLFTVILSSTLKCSVSFVQSFLAIPSTQANHCIITSLVHLVSCMHHGTRILNLRCITHSPHHIHVSTLSSLIISSL